MTAFFPARSHQKHTPIVQLDPQISIVNAVPQTHYPPPLDPFTRVRLLGHCSSLGEFHAPRDHPRFQALLERE